MTDNTQRPHDGPTSAPELPTTYAPADVEGPLYERWVERGYFEAHAKSDKPPFAVVIPPPNVTGSLHLGHAFEHTLIDALTRRKRMQGYETLWQPGMDHAGIATQNVVERELGKEGKSRHDLGREAFVERVWQWKAESGGQISGQMRRLGDGVDWSRERFTMDEGLSKSVQTIFKRLYDDELIYRAERIINWCPRCLTAISDIEVEYEEEDGELVSMRYGDGDDSIVVATTRAETMLGDTAVAVHPDDPRYRHLVGRTVRLPLTDRSIPVVADTHVDPEFGTGAVKVTPAHDPNDFEIGRRHDLPAITVMDEHAVITVSGPFQGLDRLEARSAIVAALRADGRIVAEKRPYRHSVGHCSRCKTTIEPRLSMQWWVKVGPLAKAAGDAVRDGRVAIHPQEMEKRYFDWVDNLHDWCISRQLWWGHRIPVWYGPNGETVCVGPDDEAPPTSGGGTPSEGWTQDSDVLDTWFSSGLWPFSTMGWPEQTPALEKFYPNAVLVTGYDILFFWVARMMMFGLYAMDGTPPFHTIALHGMVRDQFGKKMSKSFGNAVNPLDWMDTYGSDAVRFTLARGANPGIDVPIGEDWVQASRNFANKIWNATRFALMNGATVEGELPPAEQLSAVDRWILSRLGRTVAEVDALYDDYQFAKLSDSLFHFAWDEVFDWYVELSKTTFLKGGEGARVSQRVLGEVLDTLLRLLHPVVPFVTETLWTTLTGGESLVIADWPKDGGFRDPAAEAEIAEVQRVVTEVRRFRADQGLQPGQKVPARLGLAGTLLAAHEDAIRQLLRLQPAGDGFHATASLPVAGATVELDLSGAIDVAAERRRLTKDLGLAEKEKSDAGRKLGNDAFLAKAPEKVVAGIRARLAAAEADIERITAQLGALPEQG
ncbi:valine--tRNA ligase [Streptomyces cocklensis]|uniref:Valine--tRNA ligase n=1 Tax=Actinacidiphila cocklensis TaxID=887465 RepID=A0A9W4GS31_9ACTN|nr:valine--tRNA ligase [Actinacidiphila cocklensis]MDD1058151.1 valine--tRNA ligase [Actinacidiphila cocklensis]CAG6393192.1 valyl-tRNA synthetase [Actinacidiphila cocklensis]